MNIPGIGEVKPVYVLAGGSAVCLIAGVAYFRYKQNAASAAAASSANTNATSQANIDPATGYPYGSVQDEDALAAESYGADYGDDYGDYYGTTGPYGEEYDGYLWDPSDGQYDLPVSTPSTTATTTATGTYASNSAWFQAAVADPAGTGDANLAAALDNYLAAKPQATTTDYQAVQTTVNYLGPPPTAGYSLIMPTGTSTPHATASNPPAATTSVPAPAPAAFSPPSLTGMTLSQAVAAIGAAGGVVNNISQNGVYVDTAIYGTANPPTQDPTAVVTGYTVYQVGQAGSNWAHSVDLTIN